MVKIYRANEHPRFPAGGKMSQHLDRLALGDTIEVKGPVGHMVYEGRGAYTLNRKPRTTRSISLIAGGTGITPCWQVLRTVLADPEDTTKVSLHGGQGGRGTRPLLGGGGDGLAAFVLGLGSMLQSAW